MILRAELMESVACVRYETSNREFVGCGKGWSRPAEGQGPLCPDCRRPLVITGRFKKASLR